MVDGFVVEAVIAEILTLAALGCSLYQVLWVWRLSYNRDRVGPIQKWSGYAVVCASIISFLWFLDGQCHFGIWNETALGMFICLLLSVAIPPVFVWLGITFETVSVMKRGYSSNTFSEKAVLAFGAVCGLVICLIFLLGSLSVLSLIIIISCVTVVVSIAEVGVFVIFFSLCWTGSHSGANHHHRTAQFSIFKKLFVVGILGLLFISSMIAVLTLLAPIRGGSLKGACLRNQQETYQELVSRSKHSWLLQEVIVFVGITVGLVLSWMPREERSSQAGAQQTSHQPTIFVIKFVLLVGVMFVVHQLVMISLLAASRKGRGPR
eukprot:TRINITY_DN44143_c0_g2_i1.p1 TRINITY_DN44143_c0_g2~~TRINITY_DN44143_c0_g2_i1.p1  ORF type:complete len:321 (+),score=50.86 TRINITY_DN44143_c0_g2_i1:6-968(+)